MTDTAQDFPIRHRTPLGRAYGVDPSRRDLGKEMAKPCEGCDPHMPHFGRCFKQVSGGRATCPCKARREQGAAEAEVLKR